MFLTFEWFLRMSNPTESRCVHLHKCPLCGAAGALRQRSCDGVLCFCSHKSFEVATLELAPQQSHFKPST